MNKAEVPALKKLIILLLILTPFSLFAGENGFPAIALSGINFSPGEIESDTVIFRSQDGETEYRFSLQKGELSIPESGNYEIFAAGESAGTIRVLPGWLSLVPPLLAITLAIIIRQVLVSLAAGIYIGALFIYNYNPVTAFLRFADLFILDSVADKDHMFIILFTLLIGGVVGVISANGGTAGLAGLLVKFAKTRKSAMLSTWLMGMAVFFDDYANTLIIGNMMRPITDKLKVSREKLAYIVDSTSAPVASLMIISTWIGYELGLIADGLLSINSDANAYNVFISSIPYRFYPLASLFFVFLTAFSGREFGPMLKAEKRAYHKGELTDPESGKNDDKLTDYSILNFENAKWYNGALPVMIILFGTIAGLFYTGISALEAEGLTEYDLREIISRSDSYSSLLWASFAACVVAITMTVAQKTDTLEGALNSWRKGLQSMLFACIILTFAWGISKVTNDIKTADFIISAISDTVNPVYLPVLVFIICGFISFATGTSWGTMAIVMPIVIPLTGNLTSEMTILYGVVSSVLAGSVFGDHCSPIADTTILSSMSSKCNHIDHVRTQLPYALLVAAFSILFGDLITAFGLNPWIANAIIFTGLAGALYLFGRKVSE